jgi:undecaprenyl-diphosphatase
MLEKLVALDKDLFVFLNGLGSSTYDGLWLIITKQLNWLPFFLVVFYFLYKKVGTKNLLMILVFIAGLILVCDQSANLFKNSVQRLRPCNDPEIKDLIRIVKSSASFSFYSGHATNSMATMFFVFMIIRKHYKYAFLVFLFPLIFAYSRIYLGLHFPLDILTGYVFGLLYGFLFYKLYCYLQKRNPKYALN